MRVGKAVVDAIKTQGGGNTSYTFGQASDIMCTYRVMSSLTQLARHFTMFSFLENDVFLIVISTLLSLGLASIRYALALTSA